MKPDAVNAAQIADGKFIYSLDSPFPAKSSLLEAVWDIFYLLKKSKP